MRKADQLRSEAKGEALDAHAKLLTNEDVARLMQKDHKTECQDDGKRG